MFSSANDSCYKVFAISVVIELDAQLDTEAATHWKQDIISNLDTKTVPTIPFLLLGNKQDKVSSKNK